jgi:hypothetical protein
VVRPHPVVVTGVDTGVVIEEGDLPETVMIGRRARH